MKKLLFLALLLCFMNQSTWAQSWTDVSTASALNSAIANGAHIRLTDDITLSEYLKIGQNGTQTVEINLNGHTLRRAGLKKAETNGHVIEVWGVGTLTLHDGTLTGGWANNGGAICNYGTVTLSNVTITGCKANLGGAIKNYSGATLTLNGGVNITGNECAERGGAIWSDGTLNVSGVNTVTGNIRTNFLANNVYLNKNKVITVTGNLGESRIGVCNDGNSGTVTSGLSGHGVANNFPNDMDFATSLSIESGEIKLTEKSQIYYVERRWDANEGKVVSEAKTVSAYTELSGGNANGGTCDLESGRWYVVKSSYGKLGIKAPSGTAANLIICDGATLTAGCIYIGEGHSLNIYGQAYDAGTINALSMSKTHTDVAYHMSGAQSAWNFPGIGSDSKMGTLVIHGGTVNANSGDNAFVPGIGGGNGSSGGSVTIYGGKVKANGGDLSAGIGCGPKYHPEADGGTLTVYGGDVEASGGESGAGIGGGQDADGATVNIYGGSVRADGGDDAAGIGSGVELTLSPNSKGGTLNVYGGYVFADGTGWGAGIGGGEDSDGATVNIQGGVVEAWAGADAGDKNGSAIGSEDGDEHRGSLTIGDKMMVHAGSNPNSASLFKEDLRKPACFWRPYAIIEPCTHKGSSFTVTETTHSLNCAYCQGIAEASHIFPNTGAPCTVCGYQQAYYTVSIYSLNKTGQSTFDGYSGNPQVQNVVPGTTIVLPSVSDDYVPAADMFVGWAEGTPENEEGIYSAAGDNLHAANSAYTVNGNISFKARYRAGKNITLYNDDNNYSTLYEYDGKRVNSVTLDSHTFYKDGEWNTICLPFDTDISNTHLDGDGVDVRTLASSTWEDGVLTLNFTAAGDVTELEAGKPYLIKWNKTGENITAPIFSNVDIQKEMNPVVTDYVSFVGTYDPVNIYMETNPTLLYLGADNKLYFPSKSLNVNTCRGYFTLRNDLVAGDVENPAAARSFNVNFIDDDVTGIRSANASHPVDNAWYSIDGRRLNHKPTRSGIYVNNRRKIVIK